MLVVNNDNVSVNAKLKAVMIKSMVTHAERTSAALLDPNIHYWQPRAGPNNAGKDMTVEISF